MRVRMSHAFAVNAKRRILEGKRWNEHHAVGRFEVHFDHMANPAHVQPISPSESMTFLSERGESRLDLSDVAVVVVSANIEVVFVVLEYEVDIEPEEIVSHVYVLCRERHSMWVNDMPFSRWITQQVPGGAGLSLASDVLQFVTFPDAAPSLLKDLDGPTALCQSLISRHWSVDRRPTDVASPSELNAFSDACFAHGRGVIAVAGHEPYVVAGAMMVVIDLLFAAAEVRRLRQTLAARVEELRCGLAGLSQPHSGTDLRRIVAEVRQARLTLAVDVIPALTGVDTPDRVLDSVRETFASSLKISALVDGAQTLLTTLTQVVETFIAEHELASTARFEERQRQWQFSVSVVSGVLVPFALLLSFFGTGTQADVHPATSMWDFGRYWHVWTVAFAAAFGVLAISWWQYWRWLRGESTRQVRSFATSSEEPC